ncbi:hypothetical protein OG241_25685 [Streptomyces sp. NBC_01390]|uniref:hypothetical protein n=1 Tax=Streptomyces sp. NBC_01390 TaxID=2903850 RepID=UPI00324F2CCA
MDVFWIILAAVASFIIFVVFLGGMTLFLVGALKDRAVPRPEAEDNSSALLWLLKNSFKVAFGGEQFPVSQRMMAQGTLLMSLGAILFLGVAAAVANALA